MWRRSRGLGIRCGEELWGAGFTLHGTFTKLPKIDLDEIDSFRLDEDVKKLMKIKVLQYLKVMQKHSK